MVISRVIATLHFPWLHSLSLSHPKYRPLFDAGCISLCGRRSNSKDLCDHVTSLGTFNIVFVRTYQPHSRSTQSPVTP